MSNRDPFTESVKSTNRDLVVKSGPIRPRNDFPSTLIGQKLFKFNASWYEIHEWLEYSISKDSAHCFYCRCFGTLGKLSELSLFKIFMISVNKSNFNFVDAFNSHLIENSCCKVLFSCSKTSKTYSLYYNDSLLQ